MGTQEVTFKINKKNTKITIKRKGKKVFNGSIFEYMLYLNKEFKKFY